MIQQHDVGINPHVPFLWTAHAGSPFFVYRLFSSLSALNRSGCHSFSVVIVVVVVVGDSE
jgi:hypothetical protein